ncbi:UNVERIFIED_CONTAM: hypothetical protein K7Z70_04345 [Mycobacterium avium subsp. hominissuis]
MRELAAIHRTQEHPDFTECRGFLLGQVQPGAHSNASRAPSHHRITDSP